MIKRNATFAIAKTKSTQSYDTREQIEVYIGKLGVYGTRVFKRIIDQIPCEKGDNA
jgi:hypothetical protein